MKILGLLFGFLLVLLGAFWIFEGWSGAQSEDGIDHMGKVLLGPPALIVGLLLLWLGYPSGSRSGKDKEDR
ncbi:hypothetical protein [Alteraurantiacibacter aquimixticola]|uniref:Uncharacterized protein n=1 Tax=Alteraurantiacibacter aquimixticola TaxID=2489173 RepID=A0A4V4U946_9SPHN|nr:hypothetical protein [Alteraurantiacibacter aquimixticola]TIX50403.1 hypothetical protein E5222_09010 [Alteraurantiacibacter aquimixticola]